MLGSLAAFEINEPSIYSFYLFHPYIAVRRVTSSAASYQYRNTAAAAIETSEMVEMVEANRLVETIESSIYSFFLFPVSQAVSQAHQSQQVHNKYQ